MSGAEPPAALGVRSAYLQTDIKNTITQATANLIQSKNQGGDLAMFIVHGSRDGGESDWRGHNEVPCNCKLN